MNKNYFIRLIIVIFGLSLTINVANAQNFVNESFAKKIGENFISNKTKSDNPQLNLFHVEKGSDNQANLYIYNVEGGGFVIVSASK